VLAHGDARLPELTPARVLDTWTFDPLLLTALVVAAGVYLYAVARLRARGVSWSTGRCVLWLVGLLTVFIATSSSVGAYDTTLFTMHAVQHMLLQMLAPVPLALAAPFTLALRTLPRGGRRALLSVLHSRLSRVLTHPLVAYAIFIVSPFVLYYSPLYEATLRNDVLHDVGHLHFIMTGFLLFAVLVGVDPLPHRMPYVYRVMMIFGLGPMHVLLGIPVMMGSDIFAESYYLGLARDWGPTLLSDQQTGGGLLWIFGDVVTVAFLGGIYLQWLRSDDREARRVDRQLDRLYGDGPTMPAPWTVAANTPPQDRRATGGVVGEPVPRASSQVFPSQRSVEQRPD
jgi:putative copper resistance protein D